MGLARAVGGCFCRMKYPLQRSAGPVHFCRVHSSDLHLKHKATVMPSRIAKPARKLKIKIYLRLGYEGLYFYNKVVNFRDQISPDIFNFFKIPYFCANPEEATFCSTGSILGHLPRDFRGAVIGSGLIKDGPDLEFPNAKIWAVRGRLTRDRMTGHQIDIMGEP